MRVARSMRRALMLRAFPRHWNTTCNDFPRSPTPPCLLAVLLAAAPPVPPSPMPAVDAAATVP